MTSPILTRLYSPENFGELAVFTSLISIISVISALRYELAIPLPDKDSEAKHLLVLSIFLVIIITSFTNVIFFIWDEYVAEKLKVAEIAVNSWFISLGVFTVGIYNILNYWSIRTQRFKSIAKVKILQTFSLTTIQLTTYQYEVVSLLVAYIISQLVGAIGLSREELRKNEWTKFSWHEIRSTAKRYQHFPIFSSFDGLANKAGTELPSLIFATLFGPIAVGYYFLAQKILNVPLFLISRSVSQVFYSNASEAQKNGDLAKLVEDLHKQLVYIVLPIVSILICIGPEIFYFVFGEQWKIAGEFAKWLAPLLYFQFLASPLSVIFPVTENQRKGLLFQLFMLVVRISSIIIGFSYGDLLSTVILFSFSSSFCYAVLLIWTSIISGATLCNIFKVNLFAIILNIFIVSPVLFTKSNVNHSFQDLFFPLLLTSINYLLYYWVFFQKSVVKN